MWLSVYLKTTKIASSDAGETEVYQAMKKLDVRMAFIWNSFTIRVVGHSIQYTERLWLEGIWNERVMCEKLKSRERGEEVRARELIFYEYCDLTNMSDLEFFTFLIYIGRVYNFLLYK